LSGTLTKPQAEVVAQLLVNASLGSVIEAVAINQEDWPVYVLTHGSDIDKLICVFNTSGKLEGSMQRSGEVQEMFGVQIKVRDITIPSGYAKASAIAFALDSYYSLSSVAVEDNEFVVYALNRTSPILFIGFEQPENVLPVFTINYTVSIRQIT